MKKKFTAIAGNCEFDCEIEGTEEELKEVEEELERLK